LLGMSALLLRDPHIWLFSGSTAITALRQTTANVVGTSILGVPVTLAVQTQVGLNGWQITLLPDESQPLTMTAMLSAIGGSQLTSMLPTSLLNVTNNIAITQFIIQFAPEANTPTVVDFNI